MYFIPAAGDPPRLTGRRNASSQDGVSRRQTGDVTPQERLDRTIDLPVGLHERGEQVLCLSCGIQQKKGRGFLFPF